MTFTLKKLGKDHPHRAPIGKNWVGLSPACILAPTQFFFIWRNFYVKEKLEKNTPFGF